MARLRLQVLGAFRLFGLDGQPRQLSTRKAEALLAYLAMPMPGREVTEDEIRRLPILEDLNLYPDEVDALMATHDKVQATVEALL